MVEKVTICTVNMGQNGIASLKFRQGHGPTYPRVLAQSGRRLVFSDHGGLRAECQYLYDFIAVLPAEPPVWG